MTQPDKLNGSVIFAHSSGSSMHSPRNQMVASYLHSRGFGTLLFDLLTLEEDRFASNRFNIDLLAQRLIAATKWLHQQPGYTDHPIAYFGASTGAAAALMAASQFSSISAIVSRGGRPDLAGNALSQITAPTLLIVGGNDTPVIAMNEEALAIMNCKKQMTIVPGATHLFDEPGALKEVCRLAAAWFEKYCIVATAF